MIQELLGSYVWTPITYTFAQPQTHGKELHSLHGSVTDATKPNNITQHWLCCAILCVEITHNVISAS